MKVVLISTYDLGRQPFGLASPAAWLRRDGHEVQCADLAAGLFPSAALRDAGLVAFHLPMHTATRLAAPIISRVAEIDPSAHLCCYGLYAPLNEEYLRGLGVHSLIGGEFEAALAALANRLDRGETAGATLISLDRLPFLTPDRAGLPSLSRYAHLQGVGWRKRAGYTEASRGCRHLCRHCPVVPIYQGTFRVVPADVVLADIRQQVERGAEHITFGDPDFFNGPGHARRIVEALHNEFPALTYDVTIKIEHLLNNRVLLPVLRETGCLFVTSAVESVDDAVLERLEKGHTRAGFIQVVRDFRETGLGFSPTFIPFTPWTTWAGYRELLEVLVDLDLVEQVSPVQLALRLLIPAGSRLLDLPEIREIATGYDRTALIWRWQHSDPTLDRLAATLLRRVADEQKQGATRTRIFQRIWETAHDRPAPENFRLLPRATVPYLEEPWYC